MTHVPGVWAFALLALATFRTWKLLAEDTILDRPRAFLIRSEAVSEFVSCPWCFGFWIALAWADAWINWPHGTLIATIPFALSAVLAIVAMLADSLAAD